MAPACNFIFDRHQKGIDLWGTATNYSFNINSTCLSLQIAVQFCKTNLNPCLNLTPRCFSWCFVWQLRWNRWMPNREVEVFFPDVSMSKCFLEGGSLKEQTIPAIPLYINPSSITLTSSLGFHHPTSTLHFSITFCTLAIFPWGNCLCHCISISLYLSLYIYTLIQNHENEWKI